MSRDPLAITRGLAQLDVGLALEGLERAERLEIWAASLRAMAIQSGDLGLGGWLIPGVHLEVESLRDGVVLAELGWPSLPAGPSMMRMPLRRFGTASWDLDGGSWAPGWWSRVRRRVSASSWDQAEDDRQVIDQIASTFDRIWTKGLWESMRWGQATPGWVERIFARSQAAMKQGLMTAFELADRGDPIFHLPVLAGGAKLEKATLRTLADPKTALFVPSECGFRAFLENVGTQNVPKHQAMSMAFTWWARHVDGEVLP